MAMFRLCGMLVATLSVAAAAQQPNPPEPLPLELAVSLRGHNGRSPIDLSPDGRWVAHTIQTKDTLARDSLHYSATGVPFAEGDSRMETTVTEIATGESIRLGEAGASSWAPTWSPGGDRVAFYSDALGEAGLWIWNLDERRARRVSGITVRPFFGFEKPRFSPDGLRVLVKAVPQGTTIGEMNALGIQATAGTLGFPDTEPGEASVLVRTAGLPDTAGDEAPAKELDLQEQWVRDKRVDLAIVEAESGGVRRLATDALVRDYDFSPDGRSVAWTVLAGFEKNTQQANFDLVVSDLAGGAPTTVAADVRMSYGIEWSWAPDGHRIAWFPSGRQATSAEGEEVERVVVVDTRTGSRTAIGRGAPSLASGEGEVPPLWSADGMAIYGLGAGELWRIDVDSGVGRRLSAVAEWRMRAIVSANDRTVWTTGGGETVWVVGRERSGETAGFHTVNIATGEARLAFSEPKDYAAVFNLDASDTTGEIAFVASDQQHTRDVWTLDTAVGTVGRATQINEGLDGYELGSARVIRWRSLDGQDLGGTLLLPPGYREGDRLPLVVWVYGGSMGSVAVRRFGIMGASLPTFNMHVLATRGYAVLFPDTPLNVGSPMNDLMSTVMPGVNAAIDQGFADPERLAIMGQSYGSYSALAIITQTTRFKAAVITAAVLHPDLFAHYLGGNIGYYEQGQGRMGGSIWEQRDRYFENSPLFRFDRIETPLLIGQGENDGDLTASDAIFNALERLEKPVEYRLYEGEGHVISQRANVLDFWQRRLEFLAEHLDLKTDESGRVFAARP